MKDSRARNHQLPAERKFQPYVYIHSRSQLQARIRDYQPDGQSTRSDIYLRKQVIDSPLEYSAGICVDRNFCAVTRLDFACVVLEDLCQYPNFRKICDCKQMHVGL